MSASKPKFDRSAIRVGVGGTVFKELHPDPMIDDDKLAVEPYFSVSFDWNIVRTFKGIGKFFD